MWARLADWAVPSDALRMRPSLADRTLALTYAMRRLAIALGGHLAVPLQDAAAIIGNTLSGHKEQIRVWGRFDK